MITGILRPGCFLLVLLGLAGLGCQASHRIALEELVKLHGFRAGGSVALRTAAGRWVDFTADTPLTIALADGRIIREGYASVEIRDGSFVGVTLDGLRVEADLDDVRAIAIGAGGPSGYGGPPHRPGADDPEWLREERGEIPPVQGR